jgi:hypothetical protein
MPEVAFAEPSRAARAALPDQHAASAAQTFIERLIAAGFAEVTFRIEATLRARGGFEVLLDAERVLRAAWPTEVAPAPLCEIIWTQESDDLGRALLELCAFDRSGGALVRSRHVLCVADSPEGPAGGEFELRPTDA